MVKKIIVVVVSVILVIGISVGTTLVVDKNAVPVSTTIKNGLSAYELAVQYGYEGTVQEWLTSLEGKSAYQIALDSGYSGTESEWLASLKANLNNVTSIKNAQFNSNGELILTLSDDTVLNIGVAVGANGQDGTNGKDGVNGKNGIDGVSITTATINEKGQLVISFSDGKAVNLDKVVGSNGKDGVSVTDSKINDNGELIVSYSNGQTANLGVVIGAKGDKGEAGVDGKDGKDGIDAIISSVINASGELVITYSNGKTDNLGVIVGRDGIDGKDGINGVNGKDGISVTGAEITSNGELVLTYSNNQRSNLGKVIGTDGKDGQNGTDGKDGVDGKDGISVTKSEINAKGELVITYSNNQVDNLGVVVGIDGKDGADGKDGQNGIDGKDGVGIKNIEITNSDELVITLTNGSTLNLGCIKGADGKDGTNGKDGADGKDGANGDNGKDGVGIKKTEINALGELVITYTDDTADNLGVIVSDNGGAGTSADAPRVQINSTTNEWEISTDGGKTWASTGVKATGEKGKDGVDGVDGEDGVGVSGAEIDVNDHLIIKLSDNTSIDVGVVVGSDGKDGTNGKDGVGIKNVTVSDEGILNVTLDNDTVLTLGNIKGKDGVGIKKTEINADGKLVITYTDDKVVTLDKVVGSDGVGIKSAELTYDYMLKLTFTDGGTQTVGPIRGEKGADGVGIKDISVGNDGYLYVTFSNSDETQKIAYIKGEPGVDGKTPYIKNGNWWIGDTDTGIEAEGTDGANGKDGVSVVNSYVDDALHLWIVLSNGTRIDAGYVGVTSSVPSTNKYTVVFKDYDGEVLKTEEVESGKSATAPDAPSREGYVFAGWDKEFSNITSSIVVTAKYIKIEEPTIKVSNVTASAGATVQVPIVIMNNPGIAGATVTVTYDTSLTLSTASSGEAFSSLQYSNPGKFVSPCNFTWDSESGETTENGTILYLTFVVPSTASVGDVFEISCSYRDGDIFNDAWDDVTLKIISGGITVK